MTDQTIDLPAPERLDTAVSIPSALAARPRRKSLKVDAETIVPAAALVAEPAPVTSPADHVHQTVAAPAETHTEETVMATTIENVTQTATGTTQAHFADMNTRAKDAMEKSTKLFADMSGFTKGNVEALVESGKVVVSGLQSMAQDQAAFVRKQFEEATTAARTMASVKSPTEFVKLQGDYVRQQFDAMVQQGSRSTETMLKLAGEVVQPVANRVAVAVEKIKQAA